MISDSKHNTAAGVCDDSVTDSGGGLFCDAPGERGVLCTVKVRRALCCEGSARFVL